MRAPRAPLFLALAALAPGLTLAASKRTPTATVTPTALVMKDSRGVDTRLKRPPQRIVSLAPSVTECLFSLGLGNRVVGVTKYCDWPPEVLKLPKIGDFSRPSVEKIVALRPSLVIAARGNDLKVLEKLEKLRIPVFATDFQTVDDVVAGLETLGALLGDRAAGEAARDAMLSDIREAIKHVPARPAGRPRVYWGGWEQTLFTAGGGTLVDDLIRRAGGVNIGAEAGDGWPQLSLETLAKADPDVILLGYMAEGSDEAEVLKRLRSHPIWSRMKAVKAGQVRDISTDLLGHPSPRCVEGLRAIVSALWSGRPQNIP